MGVLTYSSEGHGCPDLLLGINGAEEMGSNKWDQPLDPGKKVSDPLDRIEFYRAVLVFLH